MPSSAASSFVVANFKQFGLEPHVERAIRNAWSLSGGQPLNASHLLKGVLLVGKSSFALTSASRAFRQLASLISLPSLIDVERTDVPPLDFSALPLIKPLADSFDIARSFLKEGEGVWGRDYITVALLAKDDSSLAHLASEANSSVQAIQDSWFDFVTSTEEEHRNVESWQRWWQSAGVPLPTTTTPKAVPAKPGVEADVEEADKPGDARFDDLNESDFTEYAWDLLNAARRLGKSRPRPSVCSVRRLVASLMLSGLEDKEGPYTGGWLLRQINYDKYDAKSTKERIAKFYPVVANTPSFRELLNFEGAMAQTMTRHLKWTVDIGRKLAVESSNGKTGVRISARHLLGAVLSRTVSPTNVDRFLQNFGLTIDELRARMIDDLPKWVITDDLGVWKRLVDLVEPEPEEQGLPTYAADSATGPDVIGITREVEAMASLVSAWSIEPPLSIGLFGEWGSGKSFFMRKMQDRVRQIASKARKSGLGQKKFGYYKNIVQVEFNAWHYVEGNLWASLVEHIFSNLRLEGIGEENIDSEEFIRKRLEKLLGEVKQKTAEALQQEENAVVASKEAEEKKKQAEANASRLEGEAIEARKRAKAAEQESQAAEQRAADKQRAADASLQEQRSLGLKDLVEEVTGSNEIRNQAQKDLELLGITKERIQTAQGLRDALKEASDTATVMGEGINILASDKRRWWLLAWVAIVPFVAAGLVWGGAWLTNQKNAPWLQSVTGVVSAIAAVLTAIIGFWKRYSPKIKPILDAIRRIKEKRAQLEQEVEKIRQERAAKAAELDEEARNKREEAAAEAKLAEQKAAEAENARREGKEKQDAAERAAQIAKQARAEAEKLQQDADALLPERRIAAFIQDRAGATDYRQLLGVPALIRRDFEKLSAMFRTQRDEEANDNDGKTAEGRNDLAIVNRIILYIDDLDRCPPDKVVEVLRAIHLLLAFPLFVVVVAVDARWMKRSLRDRFSLMLTSAPESADGKMEQPDNEELRFGQMATPDDYLEKIFQVPFWIRPLSKASSQNLINALTRHDFETSDEPIAPDKNKRAQDVAIKQTTQETGTNAHDVSSKQTNTGQSDMSIAATEPASAPMQGNKGSSAERLEQQTPGTDFNWSEVEPSPRALQLTKEERDYMVELASIIGRSPRSVKRFVNCYRLLKSALDKDELAKVTRDGTFRTTMFLLGLMTGLPDIAPVLLAELRKAKETEAPAIWTRGTAKRLAIDNRERWADVYPAIDQLIKVSKVSTLRPLMRAAELVDRFSFSPVRSGSSVTL